MRTVLAHAAAIVLLGPSGLSGGSPTAGVWPLQPEHEVVHGFDPPATTWGAGHRGVDLLGHPGEQVHAAAAGTVTFAGSLAGRGVVVVDHGATRTTYEPVTAAVHVGDQVRAGALLGTLQAGIGHCWPRTCLHWGLIRGTTYLDPLSLVGAPHPVRLLPLGSPVPLPPVVSRSGFSSGSASGPVGVPSRPVAQPPSAPWGAAARAPGW
ncbi:MAG: murein hydrolase activator EnvC family protein [Nocardioidaceae bacterium]